MRSTRESETSEIENANADLATARRNFQIVHDEVVRTKAPILSPLQDAEDEEWVRMSLAERRSHAAEAAAEAGERRRARAVRFRAFFGLAPRAVEPSTRALHADVHDATVALLPREGSHDASEDLHPPLLDPQQAKLHEALDAVEERNAAREQRDA